MTLLYDDNVTKMVNGTVNVHNLSYSYHFIFANGSY